MCSLGKVEKVDRDPLWMESYHQPFHSPSGQIPFLQKEEKKIGTVDVPSVTSYRENSRFFTSAIFAAAPNLLIKRPNYALGGASNMSATCPSASKNDLRSIREDAARLNLTKKINLNTSRRQLDATSPNSFEEVVSHAKVLAVRMSVQ